MSNKPTANAGDLSTLDGTALVARLVLVKERAIEDSVAADPYGPIEMSTAKTKAQIIAERMDTRTVLDECAIRHAAPDGLSSTEIRRAYAEAVELAAAARRELDRAEAENERLRELFRTAAQGPWSTSPNGLKLVCVWCAAEFDGRGTPTHSPGCPWPASVAQAGKP